MHDFLNNLDTIVENIPYPLPLIALLVGILIGVIINKRRTMRLTLLIIALILAIMCLIKQDLLFQNIGTMSDLVEQGRIIDIPILLLQNIIVCWKSLLILLSPFIFYWAIKE